MEVRPTKQQNTIYLLFIGEFTINSLVGQKGKLIVSRAQLFTFVFRIEYVAVAIALHIEYDAIAFIFRSYITPT